MAIAGRRLASWLISRRRPRKARNAEGGVECTQGQCGSARRRGLTCAHDSSTRKQHISVAPSHPVRSTARDIEALDSGGRNPQATTLVTTLQ
jgi:hypothetical protein